MGGNAGGHGIPDPGTGRDPDDRGRPRGERGLPRAAAGPDRGSGRVHPLRSPPRSDQERICARQPRHRLGLRRRGPGVQRGSAGSAVRRPCRAVAGSHDRRNGLRPRRRLHLQRGEVSPAGESNPVTHGGASMRPFPGSSARAGEAKGYRSARPLRGGEPQVVPPAGRWRGIWGEWRGIPVMPTYHPAFLLRSPQFKKPVWEDLQAVLKVLNREAPKR